MQFGQFITEMRRRNVFRVGAAYLVIAWLLAQVIQLLADTFAAPPIVMRFVVIGMTIGLPIALGLSWVYELTAKGIERTEEWPVDAESSSVDGRTFDFIIIGALLVAVALFAVDRFVWRGIASMPTAAATSIAVLPFVNMSDDNDYFADGLSEELLNLLSRIPDLKVAGRTSAFRFKGRNEDLREIGNALNVQHLLEGSVRRSGERLRITAQLITVSDGFHIWSQTYDRKMADIFDIQDDVGAAIVDALQLHLAPPTARPTNNVEAYALYLQALAMSDFPDGEVSEAISLLDRALELDPEFAKAYELKAMAYWQAAGWTMDMALGQRLVYQAANRALDLDPGLVGSKAYAVAAHPRGYSWVDYITAFEIAIRAEPDNVRILDTISNAFLQTGYFEESLIYAERIVELEPLSPLGYSRVGFASSALGRRQEAREAWQKARDLGGFDAYFAIEFGYIVAGEYEAALSAFEVQSVEYGVDLSTMRALIEGASNPATGKMFLDQWISDQATAATSAGNIPEAYGVNTWYLAFGYVDEAWRVIEESRAESDATWLNSQSINFVGIVYPGTGFTRHPNFVDQKLIDTWEIRGVPDICSKENGRWVCT